jgi:hypothetical protein
MTDEEAADDVESAGKRRLCLHPKGLLLSTRVDVIEASG